MIVLPTRQRLERRRDRLYRLLDDILLTASIHQVESVMRQIHTINLRLRTYFKSEMAREAKEIFNEAEEDNDIKSQNTSQSEDSPSLEELARIEADIKEGKI